MASKFKHMLFSSPPGYSLVSLACLASAIGIVLTKRLSSHVQDPVIAFYLGLASCLCGTGGLLTAGHPSNPPLLEWLLALGMWSLAKPLWNCWPLHSWPS